MRSIAVFVLTGITALSGQNPPQVPPATSPQDPKPVEKPVHRPPSRPVVVDRVVATVNDAAILMSELLTLGAGQIRSMELNQDRPLQPAERLALYKAVLDQRIQTHAMAQAAKTFGFATPQQIEDLFADEMKRDEEEQLRDLGTWQEWSKELEREGRPWETYLREKRVEKMEQFANDFAVGMRLQKQSNLFLTPRMLRETYEHEIARFVHGPRAGILIVSFEGPDADKQAATAAEIWRKEDLDGAQLLSRFPNAHATQSARVITDESRASVAESIVNFALAGPLNKVSDPFPLGGSMRVAKIATYEPARNGKFEDADVQNKLREFCLKGVVNEMRRQAVERAMQRTEYWKAPDLR